MSISLLCILNIYFRQLAIYDKQKALRPSKQGRKANPSAVPPTFVSWDTHSCPVTADRRPPLRGRSWANQAAQLKAAFSRRPPLSAICKPAIFPLVAFALLVLIAYSRENCNPEIGKGDRKTFFERIFWKGKKKTGECGTIHR